MNIVETKLRHVVALKNDVIDELKDDERGPRLWLTCDTEPLGFGSLRGRAGAS